MAGLSAAVALAAGCSSSSSGGSPGDDGGQDATSGSSSGGSSSSGGKLQRRHEQQRRQQQRRLELWRQLLEQQQLGLTGTDSGADAGADSGADAGADAGAARTRPPTPAADAGAGVDAGTDSGADADAGCITLTVKNYFDWCTLKLNGVALANAGAGNNDVSTTCVAPGTFQLVASPYSTSFVLGPTPWHNTSGDNGSGDPGTQAMVDAGVSATSSTTVVVSTASTCVWACCPFANGTGCTGLANQCP